MRICQQSTQGVKGVNLVKVVKLVKGVNLVKVVKSGEICEKSGSLDKTCI